MKSFLRQIEDKFELYESAEVEYENDQWLVIEKDTDENSEEDEDKCSHCDGKGCDKCDLKEMSVTAGVAAYQTPKAFSKDKNTKKLNASTGYSVVEEALDRKYERIIESYRKFANGNSKLTPESTVKNTIKEVSKKLKEIEEMVRYSAKLKTESGMSKDGYGPRVEKALNKISERLIKISERVRSLGE